MQMILPEEVPAMCLKGAVLLPKTLMPLRIFEQRYREMLSDALAGDRLFAIANRSSDDSSSPLQVADIATVGLIRMSSENPDGTSILMLEGLQRVRVLSVAGETPYPKLKVRSLPSCNFPSPELESEITDDLLTLIDEIQYHIGPELNHASEACRSIDDLEMLLHFIMQNYCKQDSFLQSTLATVDVTKRSKLVSDFLRLQITLILDEMEEEDEEDDDDYGFEEAED